MTRLEGGGCSKCRGVIRAKDTKGQNSNDALGHIDALIRMKCPEQYYQQNSRKMH